MITTFILGLSLLILLCFVVDMLSDRTHIPSVILLMGLGIGMHYSFNALHIEKAVQVLPILGTVALILIVIEAGFDLDYNPEKKGFIGKALLSAIGNLAVCLAVVGTIFKFTYDTDWLRALTYAIPFSIVSSAIAIPTAKPLDETSKEFLTYETVFSDVIGIILFNLFITSDQLGPDILVMLTGSLTISVILSFIVSIILIFLMKYSMHSVRFVPIFSALICIYALGKYLDLPLLITMMIFGLVLNNIRTIRIPFLNIQSNRRLRTRIRDFKQLTHELTFVTRGLFFIMFGYRLDLSTFLNPVIIAAVVALGIFVYSLRFGVLKTLKPGVAQATTYVAPRGLISILLALSIPENKMIPGFHTEFLDMFIIVTIFIQLAVRSHANRIKAEAAEEAAIESGHTPQEEKTATDIIAEEVHVSEDADGKPVVNL